METTLNEIEIGQAGIILGFAKGTNAYRKKFLAMGLIKGTAFKVIRVAPMGDPLEISVRDYSLSLRRDEAKALLVAEGSI
jgi:ferrous iron transport protein A